jgi:phosphatidylglycerophosphate synthase
LARHAPAWVGPDHLTILGFAAQLLAGLFYALAGQWPAALLVVNLCIALNWFGDSLDGTLARVRNKQRPRYGFYVDHVIDAIGAVAIMGGLALSGYITPMIAVALLVSFLLFSVETYLATYTLGTFKLSHWKFSPTEMRLLLMVGNVVALARPTVHLFGTQFRFFDVGFGVATVVMAVMVAVSVVRNTVTLYRAERV